MADCGATGTALDRVARAVTSGAGNGSNKQVFSNLLGHYAQQQQSQSQPRMPVAAPEHLPSLGVAATAAAGSRKSQFHVDHDREAGSYYGCRAPSSSTGGAATPPSAGCGTTSFPASALSADAPLPLTQQQQQPQMMMMMQQQQQQMNAMMVQMVQQQQQQQKQRMTAAAAAAAAVV